MTDVEGFTGWPAEAVDFYLGLEADNTKAYWTAHRPVYDELVLAPMQALLDELADEFGEGRIFRPNRDVRFSADKSPYKTAIGAMLGRGYVQFSAAGIGVGAGCHVMAPDQIERFRRAADDERHGAELERILGELADAGIQAMTRERLKSAPRGFAKDHPRIELLRRKDLAAWRQWPASTPWVRTAAAKEHIVETLRAARPLVDWLDEHVGATELERRR